MTYTRQVVKETLRFRPAAPMVPQVADANLQVRYC
jgi:cytochrome P450